MKNKTLKKSVISCSSQEKSDQTPNHRTDIPIFAYLHQMAAGSLQGMGMGCGQLHVVPHIRGAERLQGHRALSRLNVHRDAQMDTGPAPGKLGGKSHHVLDGKVMESHGALKTAPKIIMANITYLVPCIDLISRTLRLYWSSHSH